MFPSVKALRASYLLKLIVTTLLAASVIAATGLIIYCTRAFFTYWDSAGPANGLAVLEWIVMGLFSLLIFSYCLDLWACAQYTAAHDIIGPKGAYVENQNAVLLSTHRWCEEVCAAARKIKAAPSNVHYQDSGPVVQCLGDHKQ